MIDIQAILQVRPRLPSPNIIIQQGEQGTEGPKGFTGTTGQRVCLTWSHGTSS